MKFISLPSKSANNKINVNRAAVIFSAAFLIIFLNSGLLSQDNLFEFTAKKYLMGTEFEITAVNKKIEPMKKAMYFALKEVERIQGIMSMQIDTSEVSLINKMAGISPVKVSYETYSIIERSIKYSEKYDGVFDITVGPITNLWGFNGEKAVTDIPDSSSVESALKLVGYEKIKLNSADTSVFLSLKGMLIDLGGIAKGYAVDRASEIMRNNGISDFIVNGGGDMYISGEKAPGVFWTVGIKHPRLENSVIGVFNAKDIAVGTSGDYERYVIINGTRYHHIFDTKTGFPSPQSQSSTVIAATTEEAVVLSKYYFIKGIEKGALTGNPAVVIDSSGNSGFSKDFIVKYNFRKSEN